VSRELQQLAALVVRVAPRAGLTDPEAEALAAYLEAGGIHADAARHLHLPPSTYRSRFERAAQRIADAVQKETTPDDQHGRPRHPRRPQRRP
jgi:DNA-directed RNA polymerase specialized sigma24 family protein